MSSTIKQAILSLKSRIADAYTAIVAKGGTLPATQDSANLPSAIASIPSGGININGLTWNDGYEPQSAADLWMNYKTKLLKVDDVDGIFTFIADSFFHQSVLQEFTSYATTTIGDSTFYATNAIRSIVIPNATIMGNEICNSTNLRFVNLLNMTTQGTNPYFTQCVNLIDIVIGAGLTGNFSLVRWSPTNALRSDSSSLVEAGEPFTNNLEKLLYNIREHIAANLPTANYTFTFHANVKAAILADQATADAFTNKGWTVA